MTNDWKKIHPDFTEELKRQWEELGFAYQEVKEWINCELQPSDAHYAWWLKNSKMKPDWILNHDLLRRYYETYLKNKGQGFGKKKDWKGIHPDFTPELQKEWEKRGFNYEECKKVIDSGSTVYSFDYAQWLRNEFQGWLDGRFTSEQIKSWIEAGLKPNEADFAFYLEQNNYQSSQSLSIHKLMWLRKEYEQYNIGNFKLNKEVIEQIKNLPRDKDGIAQLNFQQQSLVKKLIPNINLRERYIYCGLCEECQQPKTHYDWCRDCNYKHFQQDDLTIDSSDVEEFIKNNQSKAIRGSQALEWIPYEQLEIEKDEKGNDKVIGEGGFGKVYKAKWINGGLIKEWNIKDSKWIREKDNRSKGSKNYQEVALKVLNNSQNVTPNFLQEVASHKLFDDYHIARCYGISRDSKTKNYVLVMQYIFGGDLKHYLQNEYRELTFTMKISQLSDIAAGLNLIHEQGLVHRDFHPGNILSAGTVFCITDLGLCRPANETDEKKVYGVMPYLAPEILNGMSYTQASDIYSFGMVAYEVLTGLPPYYEHERDSALAPSICGGLRPNLDNIQTLREIKTLIKQCWDADPEKRPTAKELDMVLRYWKDEIESKKSTEIYRQYQQMEATEKATIKKLLWEVYSIEAKEWWKTEDMKSMLLSTFAKKHGYTDSLEAWGEFNKFLCSELNKSRSKLEETNSLSHSSSSLSTDSCGPLYSKNEMAGESNEIDIDTKFTEEIKNLTEKTRERLSLETRTKITQEESKSIRLGKKNYHSEPIEIIYFASNWINIHSNFTSELIQKWQNLGFTAEQCQEWININSLSQQEQAIQEPEFYVWLKNEIKITPQEALNELSQEEIQELRKQFQTYQQQTAQILQTNLPNLPNK